MKALREIREHRWKDRIHITVLGIFVIAYACVVIKRLSGVDVQIGPKRENTQDRTGVMLELDSIQDNQEKFMQHFDTLKKDDYEKDTITHPAF